MSWTVLVYVNRSQNSKKFWSYNANTGVVAWGRIGTNGTRRPFTLPVIQSRRDEKLAEGYKLFQYNYPTHSPPESEVMEFWYGAVPSSDDPTGAVTRAREEQTRRRSQVQELSSRPTSQNYFSGRVSGSYKTNRDGYIKSYRQGYQRFVLNQVRYLSVGKDQVQRTPAKFKRFYDAIPINQVVEKRPFGFDFESEAIFGRHSGQYKFVVEEQSQKVVACFEIMRSRGKSNFFYVKTNSENYDSLTKKIVQMMAGITQAEDLFLKTKGATLAKSLKDAYDWNQKEKNVDTYYWKIKKSQVQIDTIDQRPIRYQELMW